MSHLNALHEDKAQEDPRAKYTLILAPISDFSNHNSHIQQSSLGDVEGNQQPIRASSLIPTIDTIADYNIVTSLDMR